MFLTNSGFWTILLSMAVFGVLHSILASFKFKSWIKRWIKKYYDRFYRLGFSIFAAVKLGSVFLLIWALPDTILYQIATPWRWIAIGVQTAALGIIFLSVLQTGALRFIGLDGLRKAPKQLSGGERLVVQGFYKWVRHPIYTATFILVWLFPVMSANWLAFCIGASLYMVIGSYFEEQKLVKTFGADYTAYQKQVPRFIPGIRF
jgi:protein-S-isoprenylcysteine O-methyltransferase Ste14